MSDGKLILVGAAVGLAAYWAWRYLRSPGIDPRTGATPLPAGEAFGPPVPTGQTPVTPGPIKIVDTITEGLA